MQTNTTTSTKPKRTPPRLLEVVKTEQVSQKIRRITLGGSALSGFPSDKNGAHIKVFLPRDGQSQPILPTLGERGPIWPPADQRPITRTYSVRHYCANRNQLAVDFVLHASDSPASGWAKRAVVGDKIGLAGPGGPDPLLAPADQHILAGDLTALPAIAAILETLPPDASGHVFVYLEQASHQQDLPTHPGLQLHWLCSPYSAGKDVLLTAIDQQFNHNFALPAGQTLSAFIAGENSSVVNIRNLLVERFGLRKRELYAVPYWRRGQDEESYHQQRHHIMDEVY